MGHVSFTSPPFGGPQLSKWDSADLLQLCTFRFPTPQLKLVVMVSSFVKWLMIYDSWYSVFPIFSVYYCSHFIFTIFIKICIYHRNSKIITLRKGKLEVFISVRGEKLSESVKIIIQTVQKNLDCEKMV